MADENREAVLNCVLYIANSSRKIKVCCSSRPEHPFHAAIPQYPSIRLQDFNYNDIKLHCHKRLTGTRAEPYAGRICYQAEGVFLWAYMVTEDLRAAASQGDSEEDLESRLRECPTGMNELFTFMLERQDKFYAKRPKPYLALVLAATEVTEELTLLDLLLGSQYQTTPVSAFPKSLDASQLASWDRLAIALEANVVARCANLVECYVLHESPQHTRFPDSFPYEHVSRAHNTAVRFIHRSARDFLVESEGGVAFLQSCRMSDEDALRKMVLASATSFLANTAWKNPGRLLKFARGIRANCWTSLEISAIDTVFAELQAREPWTMPSLVSTASCACHQASQYYDEFSPLCLDLSLLDNLTYTHLVDKQVVSYLKQSSLRLIQL
ncbi:hypothetical protein H2200_010036 [Cladophialophora chaetospira]|uniref:DUF7791 domain-containing protein n=1 Tax=Cladophialophora chaetospira TaxID=386627 RepID=A0AA38X246_9EURO|nr:hypothetical protein H2200_010036 [Cladophialophora chaetospira]